MKKQIILLLFTFGFLTFQAQKKIENLNFERVENKLPTEWNFFGDGQATITIDTSEKQSGNSSVLIDSKDDNGFKALGYTLPNNYEGKKITLSGYIKTENAQNGFAGLWMRIDPDVAFNNMQEKKLQGTNAWQKYEITLNLNPQKTKNIVIGALLKGKGKMWVDNLEVTIDGKKIENVKAYEAEKFPAMNDKEFISGSKITSLNKDDNTLKNLYDFGLIWGYLKYFHPKAHSGDVNWDNEFFKMFPKINNAKGIERDEIILSWIKSLGSYKMASPSTSKDLKMKADLAWISNSGFSTALQDELLHLKNAKRSDKNYYIEFAPKVNNPIFKNETNFESMDYKDLGVRMLSLYRYWNMIQYFFPYRYLIEEDWKGVLAEFIPKYIDASDKSSYTLTNLALIARIHDTHANIYGNQTVKNMYGERTSPIITTFVDNKAVVKDYMDDKLGPESGLEIGDVIIKINGKDVEKIIEERKPYTPASNYPTQLRNISYKLLNSNDETINIEILRNGQALSKTIKTYKYSEIKYADRHEGNYFKMLNPNVAYFFMGKVTSQNLESIFKEIEKTKGLVIDLRSYPSEFMVFSMGKLLKPTNNDFVKFITTSNESPGDFDFTKTIANNGTPNYYKGKIAILINETTQSQAEYTTMAFRTAPNAKVFGSTTAGADGNVSEIILPGNIKTMITGIGVYYPDGKETQRIGIIPDVKIKPTVQGITQKKDEVLDKAIEWINQ